MTTARPPATLALRQDPSGLAIWPAVDPDGGLVVPDLLSDFPTLLGLLAGAQEAGHHLDAFLLAAGATQVVEDYLQGDPCLVRRAAAHLEGGHGATRALGEAARAGAALLSGARRATPATAALRARLATLTARLAAAALAPAAPTEAQTPDARGDRWPVTLPHHLPSGLRTAVLRLPAAFRSFDQRPADVAALARQASESYAHPARPLLAVGVRTSGSYLGPLAAAALRGLGHPQVGSMTLRPGWGLLPGDRRRLAAVAAADGLVLVIDDPPVTGATLARTSGVLEAAGVHARNQVLLVPQFDDHAALPEGPAGPHLIPLPWGSWQVHRQLQADAVAAALSRLLGPAVRVAAVVPLEPVVCVPRGHARRRFAVDLTQPTTGARTRQTILAEGVGLGYLGRHALAVARALPGRVAPVVGVVQGILYRAWLPEDARFPGLERCPSALAEVAGHVAARAAALPAAADHSRAAAGRRPVWEVAASILATPLGPAAPVLRAGALDRLLRRLLTADRPSVIDGRCGLDRWFRDGDGRHLLKVDVAEGAFTNLELSCYDPLFDLVGAAATASLGGTPETLRTAFREHAGQPVDEERWLLYHLVHLWDRGRRQRHPPEELAAAASAATRRYLADQYLADLAPAPTGPWCVLDLDGVVETDPLGFPAPTRAAMLALRGLRVHGYRLLLATGRSLAAVEERCAAYGLAGGVAEYGGVAYVAAEDRVIESVSPAGRRALDRLRDRLDAETVVSVDQRHRRSVRAWATGADGRRRPLAPALVGDLLAAGAPASRLVVVTGQGQTDVVVAGVDKGTGLRALLAHLDPDAGLRARPLAMAVGDTPGDLALLALAERGFAPAHAGPSLRSDRVEVLRRPYQAGLADAVGRLLGHPPGGCPACRAPTLPPRTRALVDVLSVHEGGQRGLAARLAALWVAAVRVRGGP